MSVLMSEPLEPPARPSITFRDLPFEIRRQIWQECIPAQTILATLDRQDQEQSDNFSCLKAAISRQHQPPAISQVCYEARQVAFEDRGAPTKLSSRTREHEGREVTDEVVAWFNPERDTILARDFPSDPGPYNLTPDALGFIKATRRVAFDQIVARCVPRNKLVVDLVPEEQGRELFYAAGTWCIHATRDAVANGIDGLFGHGQTVMMVDIEDTEKLGELARLHSSDAPRSEGHSFLSAAQNPNGADELRRLACAENGHLQRQVYRSVLEKMWHSYQMWIQFVYFWNPWVYREMPEVKVVAVFCLCKRKDHVEIVDKYQHPVASATD